MEYQFKVAANVECKFKDQKIFQYRYNLLNFVEVQCDVGN